MPYCPKCDMEFVEGITVCSDCGGPLVESKEAADAMKRKAREEALARMQEEYQAQLWQAGETLPETETAEEEAKESIRSSFQEEAAPDSIRRPGSLPTHVYVKKSQQYDDLKSSASAFFLVGGILVIFSALCWAKIIRLPMGMVGQVSLTLLGLAALFVAVRTTRDAKKVRGQIKDEEFQTQKLIQWFTQSYTGDQLDGQLSREYKELSPEELSLKRFELIQDILITNQDIPDPSYVDLLAEEIYGSLYPDS